MINRSLRDLIFAAILAQPRMTGLMAERATNAAMLALQPPAQDTPDAFDKG